ncbi:hypothetical protein C8A03DRAFT_37704 [Achaetomium macrosporum]|uniref:SMP domain-containing protein n=1 Tax=Achaetomium macrosporum TaxID=79813 RepID=A0AAN7C364_9PEZI|nr:hypothetical protein C8A03DRAFT_37704 [Achaetomium macrosporum]
MGKHGMTQPDASRIQSSQAKSGGDMSSGGFAARAQSAGDRHAAQSGAGSSGFSGGSPGSSQQRTAGGTAGQQKK